MRREGRRYTFEIHSADFICGLYGRYVPEISTLMRGGGSSVFMVDVDDGGGGTSDVGAV